MKITTVIHRITIYALVVLIAASSVARPLECSRSTTRIASVSADFLSEDSSVPIQVQAIEPTGLAVALKPMVGASLQVSQWLFGSPSAVSSPKTRQAFRLCTATLQSQFVRWQI